jgi:hypothetical protein
MDPLTSPVLLAATAPSHAIPTPVRCRRNSAEDYSFSNGGEKCGFSLSPGSPPVKLGLLDEFHKVHVTRGENQGEAALLRPQESEVEALPLYKRGEAIARYLQSRNSPHVEEPGVLLLVDRTSPMKVSKLYSGDLSDFKPEELKTIRFHLVNSMIQGVFEAFKNGVINLDIKPENFLFERLADGGVEVRLTDLKDALFLPGYQEGREWKQTLIKSNFWKEVTFDVGYCLYQASKEVRGDEFYNRVSNICKHVTGERRVNSFARTYENLRKDLEREMVHMLGVCSIQVVIPEYLDPRDDPIEKLKDLRALKVALLNSGCNQTQATRICEMVGPRNKRPTLEKAAKPFS